MHVWIHGAHACVGTRRACMCGYTRAAHAGVHIQTLSSDASPRTRVCSFPACSSGHARRVCAENRRIAKEAIAAVLPEGSLRGGDGAIYFLVKLPEGADDEEVVERLIKEHRVTTIPGTACGTPGYIRIAYANCSPEDCQEACRRLQEGLRALLGHLL